MAVRYVELKIGAAVGRFRIEREIGRGGHGVVYEARDLLLGRHVALKTLSLRGLADSQLRAIEREAHLLAAVESPYVSAIHDLMHHEDAAIVVMELVEGPTLEQRLLRETFFPWPMVVVVGAELASGLRALHAAGIVHGDLKPGNLRFSRDGLLKILDLGAARVAGLEVARPAARDAVGTVPYMAPEQFCGMADERADIFSSGAVLYEIVTGYRAFDGNPTGAKVGASRHRAVHPRAVVPDVPVWLESVILRCLDRDRDRRFQSAAELSNALSGGWAWSASGHVRFAAALSAEPPSPSSNADDLAASDLETVAIDMWRIKEGKADEPPRSERLCFDADVAPHREPALE